MGRESFDIHNALWCKVKQGGVIYGKKEGLSVFTFYMTKKFEKNLKWKYLSVKEVGGIY